MADGQDLIDEQSELPELEEKLSNTDPSLLLAGQPRVNKKLLKALIAGFGGVFMLAIALAYSQPRRQPLATGDRDAEGNIIVRLPDSLSVVPEDYRPWVDRRAEEEAARGREAAARAQQTPGAESYGVYDRRPAVEAYEARQGEPYQQFQVPGARSDGAAPSQAAAPLRRRIFYESMPAALTPIGALGYSQGGGETGNQAFNAALFESAYASDYQRQNMNAIKEEFLSNARNSTDFSSYLPAMYLPSIDPYHEIKSGTFIPITLITAIHSDLPGPIEAQVIENVYDTYSGRNVLIPRGTRVHGEYSSSVAFGQNRVLIAWQRMTLPNGVSVNLQGMQGLDLRGQSGLADMVDYHITEMIAALGISSVFDLGKAAVVAGLSTVEALNDINAILAAQGSATSSSASAAQQIVIDYANKLMNQQPTITVREGNRGNIFVSKDIILPSYGAR